MHSVAIFSPSRYSLYTTAVTELLLRRGIGVGVIVVRRLLNPRRFFSEYRRDGRRLLKKIWRKLVLRERAYAPGGDESLMAVRRRLDLKFTRVDKLARKYSIRCEFCHDLNDAHVVAALQQTRPDLVVFTGGGLIREPVLAAAGHGVVNGHLGVLPRYRGMDVVEWPLLEGRTGDIGVTVHFMDSGVDTGDILSVCRLAPRAGESIARLRERLESLMPEQIVGDVEGFLRGKLPRRAQQLNSGRQYYIMHPRLQTLAQRTLMDLPEVVS